MFNQRYVDLSKTKFNSLNITEDIFGDMYEYKCTYDLDIKYTNVKTDNASFNNLCENQIFHSADTLVVTYEKRPEVLKDIVSPEDDEEGTVDYAIRDYVDSLKRVTQQFDFVVALMGTDLPKSIFEKAYNGKAELQNNSKLVSVEFDHRKPKIDTVVLTYDNGKTFTVNTPHTITNADVDAVAPDLSLSLLYARVDKWLQEDYESTIKLLNAIFGFDLQTLKGAEMK